MPKKVNVFVDGENLGRAAKNIKNSRGISDKDEFWDVDFRELQEELKNWLPDTEIVGWYYYNATRGGVHNTFHSMLNDLHYVTRIRPLVEYYDGSQKQKGVDIELAVEVMQSANDGEFDVAFLCSGDGDFEPLVEGVQALGKTVHVISFVESLSDALTRKANDPYLNLTGLGDRILKKKKR